MPPSKAIFRCYRNLYAVEGRTGRREFWWFAAWTVFLWVTLAILGPPIIEFGAPDTTQRAIRQAAVFGVIVLGIQTPLVLAIGRRLHDVDRHALWSVCLLIPLVGQIWLLLQLVTRGSVGPNRYGDDPEAPYTLAAQTP